MASMWSEVSAAKDEKRCELVLSGAEISKRIEGDGLDLEIFSLNNLNFLEISHTCLEELPDDVGNLSNLTNFILRGNQLKELNEKICLLEKLKFLDVSGNQLSQLPENINKLVSLQTLNISSNNISHLPSLIHLTKLSSINFTQNKFEKFPIEICESSLVHLAEVIGSNNKIVDIPPEIENLTSLKTLDLGSNKIIDVPGELAVCAKLKELNLKGNCIKDRRLGKLVDQCHAKQVIEYVRSHCPKKGRESNVGQQPVKGKGKSGKQKKNVQKDNEKEKEEDTIEIIHVSDSTPVIITTPTVHEIRPYIVGCIVHDVDLNDTNMKKFLSLQTKLHDTICEKRTLATIATHDLKKISGNVKYIALPPEEIKLVPLGRKVEVTASNLYTQLSEEAEAVRKEKKRSTYSGIHKYLYLLKDKPLYPCLLDADQQVISFPPITNSNGTKMSEDTTDMFFEVTGNSLPACKKIMDNVLYETLKLGLGKTSDSKVNGNDDETQNGHVSIKMLRVEQIRVVDGEGNLKVVYPSRTDLLLEGINVIRD